MLNVLVWTLKLSFCTDCWESWLKCDWNDDKWADFYSGQTRTDPTHCRLHHQLKSRFRRRIIREVRKKSKHFFHSFLYCMLFHFFLFSGSQKKEIATIYYSMYAITETCVIKHFAGKSSQTKQACFGAGWKLDVTGMVTLIEQRGALRNSQIIPLITWLLSCS